MLNIKPRVFAVLSLTMIASCASMSEQECLVADWQTVGFEDGAAGRDLQTIARHRKACAKAAVTPDLESYQRGHAEGLNYYCVYDKGLYLGRAGSAYNNVCPSHERRQFAKGYERGKMEYAALQRVHSLEAELKQLDSDLVALQDELRAVKDRIVSAASSEEQRREDLETIDHLQNDILQLEGDYHRTEKERRHAQYEYDQLLHSPGAK